MKRAILLKFMMRFAVRKTYAITIGVAVILLGLATQGPEGMKYIRSGLEMVGASLAPATPSD